MASKVVFDKKKKKKEGLFALKGVNLYKEKKKYDLNVHHKSFSYH
jgi:hypothetical protein